MSHSPAADIIGEELVNDLATSTTKAQPILALLTSKELRQVQLHIQSTIRPTWHGGPPPNFGEKCHGKLKADQWCSLIEFDLPVSLASLLHQARQTDIDRLDKVFESTMLLATAIQWATSHQTSSLHARTYKNYLSRYLEGIRALRSDLDLHPNHHNALHLTKFFPLFGPMHGW